MSRLICPNCGRAFQAQGDAPECPRCHYRSGQPSYAPAHTPSRPVVAASTFSLPPPPEMQPGMVPYQPPRQSQGTNGMAVASLVLGIIGLILWPLAFIALTLGIVGKVQTNKTRQPGGGLAIAGIVLGSFVIVIGIVVFMLVYIALGL